MKSGKHTRLITGIFFIILPLLVFTKTVSGQEATLRGLAGVMVRVDINDILINDGLTKSRIRSDVELKLQEAGIKIFTDKEWRNTEGHPQLFIQVTGRKVHDDNWKFYTFAINIQLLQDVYIIRKNQTELHQASTWLIMRADRGYIGDIRLRIKELVDSFSTDFLSANQI